MVLLLIYYSLADDLSKLFCVCFCVIASNKAIHGSLCGRFRRPTACLLQCDGGLIATSGEL